MDYIYLHRDASTSKVPVAYPTLQDRAMRPVRRTSSAYCVKIGQMNDWGSLGCLLVVQAGGVAGDWFHNRS